MDSIALFGCNKNALWHRQSYLVIVAAVALLAAVTHADAQADVPLTGPANGLYNTGVAADGTLLGHNQLDPFYTFTTTPAFGTGQTYEAYLAANAPTHLPNGWVANTADSQWITVNNSSANAVGPSQIFYYRLSLTNIPIGSVVHIMGLVAADDNTTVSANASSPFFSNYAPGVVASNYASYHTIPPVVFVAGTTNTLILAVNNNGGFATGLNLNLDGSYYTALTSTVGLGINLTPVLPLTPNQNNVLSKINAINAVGVDNACFGALTSALLGTDPASLGSALDQLSPEKLGIFSSIAFNDASFRTSNLDDYTAHRRNAEGNLQVNPDKWDTSGLTINDPTMDPSLSQIKNRLLAWEPPSVPSGLMRDSVDLRTAVVAPPAPENPADNWNFFLSGDVILGQNLSQPEIDHTNYTTSDFQIGTDYQISKSFLVGALFDYNHTDTGLDEQGSSATVDSYAPGLFASFAQGGWFANALGTYSNNSYTEQRVIDIGAFNRIADGAPTGDEEMGDLDGGYEFHSRDKRWTYGPTAGVQYTHLNIDSFTETNGCSSDLSVANEQDDSLRSRFGGRISHEIFDHDNKVIFTPYIDASWQHEFLAGSRGINSSFSELGFGTFTVSTPEASRDSALLVAGLDADISDDMTLFSNYSVQVGSSNYFGQSMQAGLKIGF